MDNNAEFKTLLQKIFTMFFYFSIGGFTLHLVGLCYTVYVIATSDSTDWAINWQIQYFVDFPVSIFIGGFLLIVQHDVNLEVTRFLSDVNNFWIPLFLFGLFGGGHWLLFGFISLLLS